MMLKKKIILILNFNNFSRIKLKSIIIGMLLLNSSVTFANWSWNIGYHNPPGSAFGLNFMKLWSNWAVEVGIGYLGSSETKSSTTNSGSSNSNSNTAQISTSGDLNLKYLFSSGTFRPYLQGGLGTAASVSNKTGANASASNNFVGAGFFLMGSSVYFYTSYVYNTEGLFQVGIGFQ